MRFTTRTLSLILASGLALPASAQLLEPAGSPADARVTRSEQGAPHTTPRGAGFAGEFVTMRDEFENYPIDTPLPFVGFFAAPASVTVPDGFEWGFNNIQGQRSAVNDWARVIDLASSPVGGNTTQSLRVRTVLAQDPGGFYTGASLGWGPPLVAGVGQDVRVSSEVYISTIAELYTFETSSSVTGAIASRLLWGGTCVDEEPGSCADIGLPVGPVPTIYTLAPHENSIDMGIFVPARFCTDIFDQPIPGCTPPPGFVSGDAAPPPIGAWTRITAELTVDNALISYIDYLNGQPEVAITSNPAFSSQINEVRWNTSFESQDAFLLVDNVEASGLHLAQPEPPPLDCPYLDDLNWLVPGFLSWQSDRWTVAPSSGSIVETEFKQGGVISQTTNEPANNQYRREMSTQLPATAATLANDLVVSVRMRTSGLTVRGLSLFEGSDLAARLFFYFFPSSDINDFDNGVFVQTNAAYDPIDPEGQPVDANTPTVGVDIVDTGYNWSNGFYRTVEMRLSANGALRVTIAGVRRYTGPGAFTSAVDTFAFESENNTLGVGSVQLIDDIAMSCDAPSCATDFDFDDMTTFADLNSVLSSFGASGLTGFTPGDANADGAVNFADLNAVLAAFGSSCQ